MKFLLFSMAFVWCLMGCQKDDSTAPRINAAFDKQVTLRQQQTGAFPSQWTPELTVKVEEIRDSRCPEDVVCVWEGYAEVALSIAAANGSSQSLTLDLNKYRYPSQATVQVDGRAYLVQLHDVTPYPNTRVGKQQKSVVLSVQQK